MREIPEAKRDGDASRLIRHEPVLLQQVVELLALSPGLVFIDCTLGGAGHFAAVASEIGPGGVAVGIDRDAAALRRAEAKLGAMELEGVGVHLVHAPFGELGRVVERLGLGKVDRVLLDLGLSSDQLDDSRRGFSFMRDGPLDMRQDQRQGLTAEAVANDYTLVELVRILKEYGEERHAQRIAQAMVAERRREPIVGTRQLAEIVSRAVPGPRGKTHPATRTFQALRMEVNAEDDELLDAIPAAAEALSMGGRIAVITFHSLEERLVKEAIRPFSRHAGRTDWILRLVGHVVKPEREEVSANPRSRSAKLRVFEKVSAGRGQA